MHKILIAALAILSASACASAPAPPPAAEPVSTVAPMLDSLTPDDDGVFTSDRSGNFTHVQSGFICPNTWSGFQRTTHTVFKPAGNDVGCNYEDASGSVVTLYAYSYPAFPPLELEMDSIMQRIVKMRNPVHEDTDVMIVAKPSARGFGYVGDAILIDGAGDEKIKTGVFLTDAGPWRLKARATYPADQAEFVEEFVALSLQGQWDRILRHLESDPPGETMETSPRSSEDEIDI